jgi:DNA-directed RNA polymerase beta subunit
MMLKDRLLDESDRIVVPVCEKCGSIATRDFEAKRTYCPICGDSPVHNVEMAYAFKLLLDELKGMCIQTKLNLVDKI